MLVLKWSSCSILVCLTHQDHQGNVEDCISCKLYPSILHTFPLFPRILKLIPLPPLVLLILPCQQESIDRCIDCNEDAHLCCCWQLGLSDWGWWWMWMGQEGRWVGGQKFLRDRKHHGRGRAYAESFWRLECSNGKYLTNASMWWAQAELPGYFRCESTSDGHRISGDFSEVINVCFHDMMYRVHIQNTYNVLYNKDKDDEFSAILQRMSSQCNLGVCPLVCTLL